MLSGFAWKASCLRFLSVTLLHFAQTKLAKFSVYLGKWHSILLRQNVQITEKWCWKRSQNHLTHAPYLKRAAYDSLLSRVLLFYGVCILLSWEVFIPLEIRPVWDWKDGRLGECGENIWCGEAEILRLPPLDSSHVRRFGVWKLNFSEKKNVKLWHFYLFNKVPLGMEKVGLFL